MPDRRPFVIGAAVLLVTALAVGQAAATFCVVDQDCFGGGFGDPCLGCVDGQCIDSAKNCGDGNPCTDDYCESPGVGCFHTPHCPNDGLVCNGEEYCCTSAQCILFGPICRTRNVPNCDDDDACTVDGACTNPSGCPHAPLNCDDGNPCTRDSCDRESGCSHDSIAGCCRSNDDCAGDPCLTGRRCMSGTCTEGTHMDSICDDDDPCTRDVCAGGVCGHEAIAGCGNSLDRCQSDTDCSSACATGRTCVGGTCTAGSALVCDDGDPCTVDSCDAASGCVTGPLAGFDVLACVCARSQPASCTDQPVPKSLADRFSRACAWIAHAKGVTGKKRTKLVTRAVTQFTKATKLATKAAGHKGLSESCGMALAERFTDNRARAIAVRSQP